MSPHRRTRRVLAAGASAGLLCACTGVAFAEPLRFADAVRMARDEAPNVRAAKLEVEAAGDAVTPAGQLPDPKVSVGVTDFPISGPLAGRPDLDNFSMLALGYSQDVPNAGKRRARTAVARADVAASRAALLSEQRQAEVAAAGAWIDLYYVEAKLRALEGVASEVRKEAEAAPARLAAGSASPQATLDPAEALAALADRRDALKAAEASARAELARWTGRDVGLEPAGAPPSPDVDDASLRASLDDLPAMRSKSAAVQAAEAAADEAKADKRPDWGYGLEYDHRDPRFGDYISGKLTFSLPIFARTRQDPEIASRLARVNAALADEESTHRALRSALDAALADHAMHQKALQRARDTLVPLAERRAALARASFAGGATGLGEVLQLQRSVLEAELDALDREATAVRDGAVINLTYGAETP